MTIFNAADLAVITKLDLAGAIGMDLRLLADNIQSVRPRIKVLAVSARTGEGLEELERMLVTEHYTPRNFRPEGEKARVGGTAPWGPA